MRIAEFRLEDYVERPNGSICGDFELCMRSYGKFYSVKLGGPLPSFGIHSSSVSPMDFHSTLYFPQSLNCIRQRQADHFYPFDLRSISLLWFNPIPSRHSLSPTTIGMLKNAVEA